MYKKIDIKHAYDLIRENGVTDEVFDKVRELPIDYIVAGILEGSDDKELIEWVTYILHEVYNDRGEVFISDDDYDRLYALNKEYNDISLVGNTVRGIKKYAHKYPMLRGTVDKIHYVRESEKPIINGKVDTRKSYEYWISNIEKKLGISLKGKRGRFSLKVDGVSGVIELEDGVSKRVLKRGEVEDNEAEEIVILRDKLFTNLAEHGECGLKAEIYMSEENFKKYKERYGDYSSPLSAVSSIINSDDVSEEKLQYLTIFDLELYKDGESIMTHQIYFDIPDMTDIDAVEKCIADLQGISITDGIPADGVVIRIMDDEIQALLGRQDNINKFEVGYKFQAKKYEAVLKDVVFSAGKGGSYTPVAKIEPVKINGKTIKSISLGSINRLELLDLRKGQYVYVTHNVVPYLYDNPRDKHLFTERIEIPTECLYCGEDLKFDKGRLYCDNDECTMIVQGKILNYVVKVGMEGISEATVETLVKDLSVKEPAHLYALIGYEDTIARLPGYGAVSAKDIVDSIASKRALPLDIIIGSLGIDSVGRRTMSKILNNFTNKEFLEMLNKNNLKPLAKIKGIGNSVVESLSKWRSEGDNYFELYNLLSVVEVLEPKKTINFHTVLFTKVRDPEFQEFLEAKGIGVSSSYTKNVDVVIYGEESKKTEKALKDGKLIMTLPEAHEVYGYKVDTN